MAFDRFFIFRRILIILVGLTMAILASAILLWWLPEASTVTSYLQIEANPTNLGFLDPEQGFSPKEFELFQQTQLTLLKSQFVLMAALSRRDVAELNAVVSRRPNELQWLNDELEVSFPGESKILMINYEGGADPEEMKKIIDAVVEAYMNEVVVAKRISDIEDTHRLEKLLKQLAVELRSKREDFYTLQKELTSMASETDEKGHDLIVAQLREYQLASNGTKNDIAVKIVDSLADTLEGSALHSKLQTAPNAELDMRQEEIDELEELSHELSFQLRKMRFRDDMSGERIQVMQKAFATENMNSDVRYSLVALGGVASFGVTCLALALIGKCFGRRDATG
ncbi:hypothetical protein [Bythopirellula polymerisocia]|uniref:Chain length determinant protein n=1 Tax=Bythopirellula polymerisocia TaxID=2528003 RepID=A0A5C6CHE8_9BACT|nr:hypothetical protein [Bythopirellula polymerisocia]TWU22646.1 Chain length determinant protein [Bythopirellula polymerisocia]